MQIKQTLFVTKLTVKIGICFLWYNRNEGSRDFTWHSWRDSVGTNFGEK